MSFPTFLARLWSWILLWVTNEPTDGITRYPARHARTQKSGFGPVERETLVKIPELMQDGLSEEPEIREQETANVSHSEMPSTQFRAEVLCCAVGPGLVVKGCNSSVSVTGQREKSKRVFDGQGFVLSVVIEPANYPARRRSETKVDCVHEALRLKLGNHDDVVLLPQPSLRPV